MYISPVIISLKLLANTEGPKIYNSSDLTDYHNIVKYIFEYAENGSFEKHAEFKFVLTFYCTLLNWIKCIYMLMKKFLMFIPILDFHTMRNILLQPVLNNYSWKYHGIIRFNLYNNFKF